jgi:hypothetical protein
MKALNWTWTVRVMAVCIALAFVLLGVVARDLMAYMWTGAGVTSALLGVGQRQSSR